ncbi:hypothetical protein [Parasitella parasitica]|uniref:Uncharacterized protein n=1 Tax=Parasitella parasitica TaxID=35722 RepID=A0A0B7MXX2_9FUNG|nr:hypothetical protein [Parasitella parasitica]
MKALQILIIFYAILAVSCAPLSEQLDDKVQKELTGRHAANYDDANQLIMKDGDGDRKVPDNHGNSSDDNDGDNRDPLPPPVDDDDKTPKITFQKIGIALLAALGGAVLGFIAAPAMLFIGLGLLGFTVAGVALGSIAAWIMSLYGGTIATGSLVSILQSMGALGFLNLFGGGLPPFGAVCGIIIAELIVFNYIF